MPGIVGCITQRSPEEAKAIVRRMTGTMLHESFYVADTWSEESQGVYVGWTVRRGSFADGMPLFAEGGNTVLIFSGEEYSKGDASLELKRRGHDLDLRGPSYLVHLYEDDPSFPSGLNGRFHGLLVDRILGKVLLFNDRYGMHRVYFHQSKDTFYFAAEAKAILAVCPELRKLDVQSGGEFVRCGAVLENRTLFDGIEALPPGSAWVFRHRFLEQKSKYFDPKEWEEQEPLDANSYYEVLRSAFSRYLPRYFEGAEKVGMSLTGGLDSRIVLAGHLLSPGTLPCYTFGSMFRESQDVKKARRVAEVCAQPFQVLTAGAEFLSDFQRYAQRTVYLTDGCMDVSQAPDLYLNERAREIAPVRMSGLFGGEILRGVRAFKPATMPPGLFTREFSGELVRAGNTYNHIVRCHPVHFAAFRQCTWSQYGSLSLEESQVSVRSPFLDNNIVRTAFRSPPSLLHSNNISLRLIADGNKALVGIPTDRGLAGNRGRVREGACRGVLEVSFKAEYAYDIGMPQWLARVDNALAPLRLERIFLGRHKPFHFRVWYRDTLAEFIQDVLLDPRALSRPYIERRAVEAIVLGHCQGKRNYTSEIHKLLSLELLHRLFLDGT